MMEMAHRVTNEYASAIGCLSLAATRTSDSAAKAALDHAMTRLIDFARTHRALQPPSWTAETDLADYLQQVGAALVRSILRDRNVKLTIVSDAVSLEPDRCWRVGLIISELVTNAARHAFSRRGGAIRVEIAAADDLVHCRVSDDGDAPPWATPGRGSEIVEALAEELGGRISWIFGDRGTNVLLSFPNSSPRYA